MMLTSLEACVKQVDNVFPFEQCFEFGLENKQTNEHDMNLNLNQKTNPRKLDSPYG